MRAREHLALLQEAHRLSLSDRAKHSWQRSSWSAGKSTDAKGSDDRTTSPGANARSATTHRPRPGLCVVRTLYFSLRYRSRVACRRGESAKLSGDTSLSLIGAAPALQSSASSSSTPGSSAAAARAALLAQRVEHHTARI